MQLAYLDWIFIIWYFIITLSIGVYYAKRASGSISEYFISNRALPWYIAGTSMVATTFAADTPLAVTELVAKYGIAGNWFWWSFVASGMLTVFLFSKLWRAADVLTDVEFTELRYKGKSAAALRCFRAVYLGLPINCIIMGWVILAMATILGVIGGIPKWQGIIIALIIALIYCILSGFWGVVTTDFLQFAIAMIGSISLAIVAVSKIGGIEALKTQVIFRYGQDKLSFLPQIGQEWMLILPFIVYIAVQWWASWYPGAEPGGGGYIAQRMFASKSKKHSLLATLWFNLAHYTIRPWPWILTALVAILVYPEIAAKSPKECYPKLMMDYLPIGLKGLMIAAFFAAFMSTIDTHLNWGASYIINDFYKRFIKKDASEKHYVLVSRIVVILIMILAGITAYFMTSIEAAWKFLVAIGAGCGAVYILRWYWWRINAFSEIAAMCASFVIAIVLIVLEPVILPIVPYFKVGENYWAFRMLTTVSLTIIIWLIVTYLTKPVEKQHLIEFYKKVNPGGLWSPITKEIKEKIEKPSLIRNLINWLIGCLMIYMTLFGFGKIILGEYLLGILFLIIACLSFFVIYKDITKE